MIIASFEKGEKVKRIRDKMYMYDYGHVLRIQGLKLPTAVEVQFSMDKVSGETKSRIGTTKDGVTDVVIPDFVVEKEGVLADSYYFYAFVYVIDENSTRTECRIEVEVKTRAKPEPFDKPEDREMFEEAIRAVNECAERAENAEKGAEEIRDNLNLDLSEKVTRPDVAEVGQVLAVKSVNEEGKPAEFEAKDMSGGVSDEKIAEVVGAYMEAHPIEETDPTVPDWAKQPEKPTYTAEEVGALPVGTKIPSKTSELQNDSGFLTEHQDLSGYATKDEIPKTASDVGADASGTAESKVSAHNVSDTAHNDIRLLIQGLIERLNALANSDDETLDQMNEVVAYIKSNKSLIDAITTSKVNVSDIIDNLTTNVNNKPLSAAQGVALKALIDGITIPEKLPNPQKLTFSGAVTAEYDGSEPLTVEIPSGGDGSIGHNITITELASGMIPYGTEPVFTHTGITFGQLNDYKRIAILIMNGSLSSGADWVITHNEDNTLWKMINLTSQRGYIELRKVASHIWDVLFKTNTNVSSGFSSSPYAPNLTGNSGYIAGTFMLNFANTQNDEICIYNKSTTSADVNWVIQGMNF